MRTKPGFRLMDVCGTHILVAEGKENIDFNAVISMNDTSKLLWDNVQGKTFTVEDLAKILTDNYQLTDGQALPLSQAMHDAQDIVGQWLKAGIIE